MSNDKTAEEIERERIQMDSRQWNEFGHRAVSAYINGATHEHNRSAQQLKEYKDVIRELLPYVNNRISVDLPDWEKKLESLMSLLNRANKLIDQTDTK